MPIFIDVFHEFYGTAIVPTFIDIVPFLINIVPTYNLFLLIFIHKVEKWMQMTKQWGCVPQWERGNVAE